MSSTYAAPAAAPGTAATTPSLGLVLRDGVAAVAVATVGTPLVAVLGQAAGISLDVGGAPIPATGFAVLTLAFSLVGLVIAVALRRFAARPRTAWVRTTTALVVLSLVPDVLVGAPVPTTALLMLTHLVAAAIVVPTVARRLR